MTTKENIQKVKQTAETIKAMVIGDVMLDKYILGIVERISPEAPVPVLTHQVTELKAGGAANVALNLAAWGCDTSIIGLIGADNGGELLKGILDDKKIGHHFLTLSDRVTTVKTRVVASSHHLLRIDEETTTYLQAEEENNAVQHISAILKRDLPDLIILEDYNKGFLTKDIIASVIEYGQHHKVFIAVDPKDNNFMNYRGVDLFKPNLREASLAAHKSLTLRDLPELTGQWMSHMNVGTIAITLGGQGVFLQDQVSSAHIKPFTAIDVVDVCGAGDAVICTLALAQMSGLNLQESGDLANLTGAYVCSHSGVVAIVPEEIEKWI